MSSDDWNVQVSVKHGPEDDRGNPMYLTNLRGHTVREVREQAADLAAWADELAQDLAKFSAVGAVRQRFPDSEKVASDKPAARAGGGGGGNCAHGGREYRSGFKDGKKWEGWFCRSDNKADKCAVAWVD